MHHSPDKLIPLVACGVIAASLAGAAFGYFKLDEITHQPFGVRPSISKSVTSDPTPIPAPTPMPTSTAIPNGKKDGDFILVTKQDFKKDAEVGDFERAYGTKLTGYNGFYDHANKGLGYYDPASVLSVKDGILNYHLHTANGKPLISAVTPTGYKGQRHGKYVIRFRADLAPGYRIAFLLWPDSEAWKDGEIDFPEVDLTPMSTDEEKPGSINGFSHDITGNPKFNPLRFITREDAQKWHTATIEWTPNHVSFDLDGRSLGTTDPNAIPKVKMHWVLQTQTSSTKRVAPAADVSGNVEVDWYAQYAYMPKG